MAFSGKKYEHFRPFFETKKDEEGNSCAYLNTSCRKMQSFWRESLKFFKTLALMGKEWYNTTKLLDSERKGSRYVRTPISS